MERKYMGNTKYPHIPFLHASLSMKTWEGDGGLELGS